MTIAQFYEILKSGGERESERERERDRDREREREVGVLTRFI